MTFPSFARPLDDEPEPLIELTEASQRLFRALADDAPNWGGTPLLDISAAERGNLTDLKTKGLLATFENDGAMFADFTASGREYARRRWFINL